MSVILCNRGDEYKVIAEEQQEWIHKVLVALGVDESILSNDYDDIKVREHLDVRSIEVWKDITNNTVDILRNEKVVAQWKQPKLTLVKEGKNDWYYEIQLNEWALPFQMQRK